ncbi:MAG: hypothetical protein ABH840_01480 [Nanoarchaeota archaeon]
MLLEQTKKDFRTDFLLKFTKELIENTSTYQKSLVEAEVKVFIKKEGEKKDNVPKEVKFAKEIQKKEIKKIVHARIKEDDKKISEMYIKGLPLELKELSTPLHQSIKQLKPVFKKPVLRIQEHPLPATVSYLKPTPTNEEINLGNLNTIIQDPLVKIIECNGPNENIFVGGIMGRKPTATKLSQNEIEEILGKFATASKIPVHEGLFKAAIGNLVISAVISEIAGIKFVIRKISREF